MTGFARVGFEAETSQLDMARDKLRALRDPALQAEDASKRLANQSKKTGNSIRDIASGSNIAVAAMGKMKVAAVAAGAAMAGAFAAGAIINTLADFSQAMSQVQAITRATSGDLRAMRKVAADLGRSTEFSATQAAQGLQFLGMAGFSAAEGIAAIPAVLDLATASAMDLGAAADISSNIMSGFGIAAGDASKVADILAAASSRANTDVGQLGEAMKFVAPVAASLGISMNDTAAAIGKLSDAGIQGGMAGTSLRSILSRLVNPTGEAADAINALGFSVNDLSPKMNSITDIIGKLESVGLDATQAMKIFGQEAGPAILALVSQKDGLDSLTVSLSNVDGAAAEMAKTMRDNLRGDINGLWSSVEGLVIAMGDAGLTAVLRGVVKIVTEVVRAITTLANGIGWVINEINAAKNGLLGFGNTSRDTANALDAVAEAANRELTAVSDLTGILRGGVTMSIETARAKRDEAVSRRENLQAALDEARGIVMASEEYQALTREIQQLQAMQSTFQNGAGDGGEFAPNFAREGLEKNIELLVAAHAEQQRLLQSTGATSAAYQENENAIRLLNDAIAAQVDGQVTVGMAADDLTEATGGLATAQSDLAAATYQVIPGFADLREEYGDLAFAAREAMEAQNALAVMDMRAEIDGIATSVSGLVDKYDLSAEAAHQLSMAINTVAASGTLGEQARAAGILAQQLFTATGGVQNMDAATREAYVALLSVTQQGAALANTMVIAGANAGGLRDKLATLAGAILPAVGAANALSGALGGVLGRLGGIARALPGLSAIGNAVDNAISNVGGIFSNVKDTVVRNAANAFGDVTGNLSKLWKSANQTGATVSGLSDELAGMIDKADKAGGAAKKAAGGADKLSEAQKKINEMVEEGKRVTEANRTELEKYSDELARLKKLQEGGYISTETLNRATKKLNEELASSNPLVNKLTDAFGEFVAGGFKDAKSLFSSILSSFKSMIAEMIATAARNKIMLSVSAGGGGIASGIGSALGGLGGASGIGATLSGMGSSFMGSVGAMATGAADMAGFMSTIGSATSSLSGFAAAAGAVALPLAAVTLGFMAFRKKTEMLDKGIAVTAQGMDLAVQSFEKVKKSRFFGLMSDTDTNYKTAGADTANPLTAAIGEIQKSIVNTAQTIGVGVKAFRNFDYAMKISTKGLSESEVAEKFQEEFAKLGDAFAREIPNLHTYIRGNESASDALTRLSVTLSGVNGIIDTLGHTFEVSGLRGAAMAQELADAFGGLDAMSSATNSYFSNFYSEEKQRQTLTRQTAETLKALNIAMPKTREQYKGMVEALDLTTTYGRETYAALVGLSDAFDKVLPSVENFTKQIERIVGRVSTELENAISLVADRAAAEAQAASAWYSTAQTLRSFANNLVSSASSGISAQGANSFNLSRYNELLEKAKAGDIEAAANLTGAASALIESNKAVAKTAFDQAKIEAKVFGDLKFMAGIADVEGARHDVISGLLETQLEILDKIKEYIESGKVIDPNKLDALNGQLASVEGAIKAAEMINYNFLKERLAVTVDLLPNANIPDYLKRLISQAQNGIESTIDFIVGSDLAPDMKWLALTGQSEHLKTIETALVDGMPNGVLRLALAEASKVSKTVNFVVGSTLPADMMRAALVSTSEMLRKINFAIGQDVSPANKKLLIQDATTGLRSITLAAQYAEGMTAGQKKFFENVTGANNGKLTLGGSFQFDPTKGFKNWYEDATEKAIKSPINSLTKKLDNLSAAINANTKALPTLNNKADGIGTILDKASYNASAEFTRGDGKLFSGLYDISNSQLYDLAKLTGVSLTDKKGDALSSVRVLETVSNKLRDMGAIGSSERLHRDSSLHESAWNSFLKNSGLPMFAAGGFHDGGLAVAGENGPELINTGPARIFNANDTKRILSGSGKGNDEALRKEIAELRRQAAEDAERMQILLMNAMNFQRKTAEALDKFDKDGLPKERT